MRVRFFGCFALLAATAVTPAATIINFDDLPASSGGVPAPDGTPVPFVGRTVPNTYNSSLLTFTVGTAGAGLFVFRDASQWQGGGGAVASLDNVVCPVTAATATSANCIEPLLITFMTPVNALSFFAAAWTDTVSVLRIEVFTQTSPAAPIVVNVPSPRPGAVQGQINVSALSGASNITAIRLVTPLLTANPAGDRLGLVYDNFTFDLPVVPPPPPPPTAPVPEPSSVALALLGLGLAGWRRAAR